MRRYAVSALVLLLLVSRPSHAQQQPLLRPATPADGITGILDALRSYAIVALAEGTHGNEQEQAFRVSLVRDPRFAERVNDIVLEGPNSRYQDLMDRYDSVSVPTNTGNTAGDH